VISYVRPPCVMGPPAASPIQDRFKQAEFTGRRLLVPCGKDKRENLRGRAVPAPILESALSLAAASESLFAFYGIGR